MKIDVNAEGASIDASTEELGQAIEGLGIGITANEQPQEEMATEQATATATAEEPVVGEAGPPTAGLGSTFKGMNRHIKSMLKDFYKDQSAAHDVHHADPTGRTDATAKAVHTDPGVTPQPGAAPQPDPSILNLSDDDILDLVNTARTPTDLGDEASYVMNFKTLENDEIAALMERLATINKKAVDEQRRGVITVEETDIAAKLLRSDPLFVKEVLNMEAGTAVPAEKLLAMGQMVELLLKDIAIVGRKAVDDPDAMELLKKYMLTYDRIYMSFKGGTAETGRGMNILQHLNTEGDNRALQVAAMMQQQKHGMTPEIIARSLAATDTPEETAGMIEAIKPSGFEKTVAVLTELRMNSMLSGWRTHLVNFLGSVFRTGADVGDTFVASFFNRNDPNFDKIADGEWRAKLFSLMYSHNLAWEAAKKSVVTGKKYGDIDKMDDPEYMPKITNEYLGTDPESKGGWLIDQIGNIIRSPTQRLMGGTDAYNKYMAEQASLAGQAYSRAINTKKQNPDIDEVAMMKDLLANPTEEMKIVAKADGESMTFQEELGNGVMGDIGKARTKSKLFNLVVPFYKTPVNLMKQGFMERTVFGIRSKAYKADIKAGGRRAQMAKSKMLTGNMVGATMMYAASQGLITGHYSKDKQVRDAQIAAGMREMSLRIPHDDGSITWVSFDRLEPFSYIFGMAADMGQMLQGGQMRELTESQADIWMEAAGAFTLAVADNTLSKTFMVGVKDAIDATQGGYKGENFLKRTSGSFLPFASLFRSLGDTIDPTMRRPEGFVEYWENTMNFWNRSAGESRDALGKIRHKEHLFVQWMPETSKPTKLEIEMMNVARGTGDALVPYISNRLGGVKLSPQQQSDWAKYARQDTDFIKQATEIISSPEYKNAFVTTKIDRVSDLVKIYDGSMSKPSAAVIKLLEKYPDLKRKVYLLKFAPAAQLKAQEEGTNPKSELADMLNEAGL